MKIGVKGQEAQIEELKALLAQDYELLGLKDSEMDTYDVIFDLDFDSDPSMLAFYADMDNKLVVLGAVRVQLEQIHASWEEPISACLIGMNTLPGFIHRNLLECTALNEEQKKEANSIFTQLGLNASFVRSRVGMVTPRIICMIINEAFFTVQEGTATEGDIDLGMKLGTAYPKGPFEWLEIIGVEHVYETLEAMYLDTRDERYKICPALKTAYLKAQI